MKYCEYVHDTEFAWNDYCFWQIYFSIYFLDGTTIGTSSPVNEPYSNRDEASKIPSPTLCGDLTLYPTASSSPSAAPSASPSPEVYNPYFKSYLTDSHSPSMKLNRSNSTDVIDEIESIEYSNDDDMQQRYGEDMPIIRKSKKQKSSKIKNKKGHHLKDGHQYHGDPSTYTVDRCGRITYFSEATSQDFPTGFLTSKNMVWIVGLIFFALLIKYVLHKRRR